LPGETAEVILLAITPDCEGVIERAARTCYLSGDKIDEGSAAKLIGSLIRRGHFSVLEHATATFKIKGGSRSFTHQLVRHRLASYSQQSQRYVDESNFSWVEPRTIRENPAAHEMFTSLMEQVRETYARFKRMGIPNQDARFVLPNAVQSEIVLTANFREFRHIFKLRCHRSSQWEIRRICLQMLKILREKAPAVFGDFVIDEANETAETDLGA